MNYIFTPGHKLVLSLTLLILAGSLLASPVTTPTYAKQGADFGKYHKVMIKPLNLENIQVLKPAWEQDNSEVWSFDRGTGTAVQELFMAAMKEALETKGGYPLVSVAADDVLRVEVELLSITPYVKPGVRSGNDGYEVETLGSGELVISAEFRDSKTRELLMLVEGERNIGDTYKKLTRENHKENLKQLFTSWGVKIRAALDKQHGH